MHVVIVAGGIGSRLAPLTNHIPKFLVNIGKETGFVEQIKYWRQYNPESITVIVHSAYKDLVQAYYDLYFAADETVKFDGENFYPAPRPFIVKTVDVANGSAHAIATTCQHLEGQAVMFMWCDVIPAEMIDLELLNHGGTFVFTNFQYSNRYTLVQTGPEWSTLAPRLAVRGSGGIFGMYYLSNYQAPTFQDGQDFVEVLETPVKEIKIKKIIDFGDMQKLNITRSTADKARSFNAVEMHGDFVLKKALNTQGADLIKREIKWYDELNQCNSKVSRPKIWVSHDENSFVMTKAPGLPIWMVWPELDSDGRELVLKRIFEQLNMLHDVHVPVDNDVVLRDLKIEACDKLLSRYREIKQVVSAFGSVTEVNGYKLRELNPEVTINKLYAALHATYAGVNSFSLIHGDLQMSNSMIDPNTLEVTLIDPRGYFGKTITYGLADYDIAKLYYSLSGYDGFNYSTDFHIKELKDGSLRFDIPKPPLEGCESVMNEHFFYHHQLWLAVIWIGLAQYIKNDPVKSLCAHYHGLAMAEQVLNETFDRLNP